MGFLGADGIIIRIRWAAARVTRNDIGYALHVLEDGLHSPEAAPGEDRGIGPRRS
jgi:hypothetical protein